MFGIQVANWHEQNMCRSGNLDTYVSKRRSLILLKYNMQCTSLAYKYEGLSPKIYVR
jgi:hypothetical protein